MCRRNTLRVASKCAALLHRPAGSDSRLVWLRYEAKVVAYSSDCGWKRFKEALTRCRCSQLAAHLIERTLRPHILIANRFLGSRGSTSCQRADAIAQIAAITTANVVSARMIKRRGGNDFFSGTLAGSMTLTVGISFAS